jgi:hypothetical protein
VFSADYSKTFSISGNLPFLNSTNSHLFFGGNIGGLTTFDRMEVEVFPLSASVPDSGSLLALVVTGIIPLMLVGRTTRTDSALLRR